jgi:hypothetical protein
MLVIAFTICFIDLLFAHLEKKATALWLNSSAASMKKQ